MKKILLVLCLTALVTVFGSGFSSEAHANKNMGCYGLAGFFGPAGASSQLDGSEGRLKLSSLFKNSPAVSFSEDSSFKQRLGMQAVPALGGGVRPANLEYAVALKYEGEKLVGASQSTHEVGKPEDSLMGATNTYDWVNGQCRPTKISVKNKLVLGGASGVLFDAKLCYALKKKGLDPEKGAGCVADAQAAFGVMQEFDKELRASSGEAEVLVAAQQLIPGGLVLVGRANDSGYALQAMASCAEFARAARPQGRASELPQGESKGAKKVN